MSKQLMVMVVVVLDDDGIPLGDDKVLAIDLAQDIGLEDIFRRSGCMEAGFEKDQTVHPRADHVDVVGNQQDGQAQFFMEVLDQFDDVMLGSDIQSSRRFIQQEHLRLLSQRSGNEHALLLTAREVPECRVFMRIHSYVRQGVHGDLPVLR